MSWWRKKQEQDLEKDNILDLDTVVWRGVDPMERVQRLAATAEAEQQREEGIIPDPARNNYIPTKPLPSVPLPVQKVNRFIDPEPEVDHTPPTHELYHEDLEANGNNSADNHDDDFHGANNHDIPPRALTTEEEFIEAEIRAQILSGIQDQIIEADPAPEYDATMTDDTDQTDAQQISRKPSGMPMSPDVSDAIKTIVADEIGGWLNHNVHRIIAESVTASLNDTRDEVTAPIPETPEATAKASEEAAQKTAKKAAKKATSTKTVKKAAKAAQKTTKKKTAKKKAAAGSSKMKAKKKS